MTYTISFDDYMNIIARMKDYINNTDNDGINQEYKFFDYIQPIRICRNDKERDT